MRIDKFLKVSRIIKEEQLQMKRLIMEEYQLMEK